MPELPAPKRILDFLHHERELGSNRYVYAVISRRAGGLSIGVNLHPCGTCNFRCGYCQVDRSRPRPGNAGVDLLGLQTELDRILALVASGEVWGLSPFDGVREDLRRVVDIAFAGDGEPTLHVDFARTLDLVLQRREAHGLSSLPLRVLSNASRLHEPEVVGALQRLSSSGGEAWLKLDAGTEHQFRLVNRSEFPFQRILQDLTAFSSRHDVVLQSLFSRIDGEPPPCEALDAWATRLEEMLAASARIREVQVTTVARAPTDPSFGPLSTRELDAIADRATALGLRATVHPSNPPTRDPP
jgi:wyosine [tRNA(Phe)-imidazoG37] synthetase (radical SAM superfamily)